MSTYRGAGSRRWEMAQEEMDSASLSIFTWRQFASAVSGNTLAGIAPRRYYRESEARGIWIGNAQGRGGNATRQFPGGQLAEGQLAVSLNVCPGLNDELIQGSAVYRIDTEPMPSQMNGRWIVVLSRGDE